MGLLKKLRRWLDKWPRSNGGLTKAEGRWCVHYPDGEFSIRMKYNTACDYAAIFGGDVVHMDDRATLKPRRE